MSDEHRFSSWVRHGVGAARTDTSSTIRVRANIEGAPVAQVVTLMGPGDVIGITKSVARREPVPRANGVAPAMFPLVEFRSADLPWRYSPTLPGSTGLMPWIALVIVQANIEIARVHGAPLPAIEVSTDELPPWAELPLWCHVQLAGSSTSLARLVCPRRLAPNRRYHALVVPTFEAGRRAGLGEEPTPEQATQPAWSSGNVRLPIYDSWEFTTGDAEDFETLARRLRGLPAESLSPLSIDLSSLEAGAKVSFFGLLRPHGAADTPPPATTRSTLAARLTDDPNAVAPPIHGAGPAGRRTVTATETDWLADLNLDPRWRMMAGVGAEVVRVLQEELVAAAWDIAGAIRKANRITFASQLSTSLRRRLVSRVFAKRAPELLLPLMAPALAGDRVGASLRYDRIAPSIRRAARPSASWVRDRAATARPLAARAADAVTPVLPPALTGIVTASTLRPSTPTPPRRPSTRPGHRPLTAHEVGATAPDRHTRIARLRELFERRPAIPVVELAPSPAIDAAAVKASAIAAIHAKLDNPLAIQRIDRGAGARPLALGGDLVTSPDLSRPLADEVAKRFPQLFAAGLEQIPNDRVIALEIDARAIEALLAGANHELARELVWREYPLDLRATMLRVFWDRRGAERGIDIPPIRDWQQPLGKNAILAPTTVIVIRGELVRRFPDAIFGHVAAVADPEFGRGPDDGIVLPRFRGRIGDDTVYVGLAADLDSLRANLGSYFLIVERPGGMRFGLDATAAATPPETWDELAWSHVASGAYATVGGLVSSPVDPEGLAWGRSGAHNAAITERPAVRLAIHLDELLREDSNG